MASEIKARISDERLVVNKLKELRAEFIEQRDVIDIYFRQPKGKVLKLSESKKGDSLIALEAKGGGFAMVSNETLADVKTRKASLKKRFGIKAILKKRIFFYRHEGQKISINRIKDRGVFLIVEGDAPQISFVQNILGTKKPQYITVPFDQVRKIR